MKLRDLIERLQEIEADLVAALGDEVKPEVVAAYQPSWPLAGEIDGACVLGGDDDVESTAVLLDGQPVVWIAVGSHPLNLSPYAPRAAFDEAR